ncbi:YihY/virulence factor BrkB family protein [Bacillus methanolicus]|uniref:Ribonuclease BN n=1 Tax=Bacillus methanolicus (strain MGA3 / ATCC 53907) TaxID=796606 RepID=I3E2R5_BACMM|nr:YihY/virulence factor BrkB family protein [Bacillus methanolicus]AIE59114.1 ribonuclease BN [Bacillus methanolicus MGA3]EIJ80786.1 ribonuclease BN [Bacillus methanolicus MGA3]UQD51191.1 YihY/virulence factor BrkB family protein [Bacillus methanolicus]
MGQINAAFIKQLWMRIQCNDVPGLAAQLAYFFLLSLFPLLIFLVTLLPYLPITEDDLLRLIEDFAPRQTMAFIESNINQIMSKNEKLLSFGIIAAFWSASNGLNIIVRAFNQAYEVKESRPFFVARGMAILLTVGMIIVFIVALLLPVFGRQIGLFLFSEFGLSSEFLVTWNAIRWFVSSIILFVIFTVLYWIAPNKKLTCISAVPGALFATVGWILTSLAFSFYVGNFGNYSAAYGSIGAVIVLMVWFYLTGFIIIIGGEINAIFSRQKEGC